MRPITYSVEFHHLRDKRTFVSLTHLLLLSSDFSVYFSEKQIVFIDKNGSNVIRYCDCKVSISENKKATLEHVIFLWTKSKKKHRNEKRNKCVHDIETTRSCALEIKLVYHVFLVEFLFSSFHVAWKTNMLLTLC